MVLKTELCRLSGAKIYPGKGIRFIRSDCQVFLFSNSKCKRYFHNHLKPAKLTWTARFRKQHKKDIHVEAAKKRRRTTKRLYSRSIVGAFLDVIQKKRAGSISSHWPPKGRLKSPSGVTRRKKWAWGEIKERIKKTKNEKRAKKVVVTMYQKAAGRVNAPKPGKAPKVGGGGGKR
ncbi:hypothetical protein CFC21_074366 [Triticum aestivum]|uniref:Large ribosomal subunit protein eL24-related N-terminal domain-containing protein n=2 Tax=Triticum aestivum TaxID=4565 RepID=A0A3B6LUU8_WHEAT|nr:hypothetical protein CFC21_074366 [Triticum aestivum]